MTQKQLIADKTDLPNRQKSENLPDGLYYFEDELEIEGVLNANVITCAGWLLELLKLDAGEISFFSGEEEIRPHFAQLAIFYPPFTVTNPCFRRVKARLKGIAGIRDLPAEFSKKPFVFETDFAQSPKTFEEVVEILNSRRHVQLIDANPKASLL